MEQFYQSLLRAAEEGIPCALGILTRIEGSSPQKVGAKAVFFADGRIEGTLGGGCLEAEIQDRARRALLAQEPARFELVLDHDFGWDDGLICGGRVEGLILPRACDAESVWRRLRLAAGQESISWGVREDFSVALGGGLGGIWLYQETIQPACLLWVAGSGHVAQAVVPLAQRVEFAVTVFDDRPALANDRCFPKGTQFRVDYWEKLVAEPLPEGRVFGLIVTRGHKHDALVLRHWLHQPFVFLGMIGSRRKKRILFDEFVESGLATREQLGRVACPVGVAIHSVSVDEIAVSIVAQLIQQRALVLTPARRASPGGPESTGPCGGA